MVLTNKRDFLSPMAVLLLLVWLGFRITRAVDLSDESYYAVFLDDWLKEVTAKRPRTKLEVMEREMETAVANELYERAAEIRDNINKLKADSVAS